MSGTKGKNGPYSDFFIVFYSGIHFIINKSKHKKMKFVQKHCPARGVFSSLKHEGSVPSEYPSEHPKEMRINQACFLLQRSNYF